MKSGQHEKNSGPRNIFLPCAHMFSALVTTLSFCGAQLEFSSSRGTGLISSRSYHSNRVSGMLTWKHDSNFVRKKIMFSGMYSKTCVKQPISKRPKSVFQYQLLLNAGRKYCRMLPLEHSAMLSTFIKHAFDLH